MIKFFKKHYLYISIFSLNALSTYSSDTIDETSIRWQFPTIQVSDKGWHLQALQQIKESYKTLKELDSESSRNIATFRLMLEVDNQLYNRSYNDIMFVSGGNEKVTNDLAARLQIKTQCIAHYCPVVPTKPKDFALRKNIVEFFEFEEDLSKRQKTDIRDAFSDCISDKDYFTEFVLSPTAIAKLLASLDDSLCYRQFNDKADSKARELGLINKTLSNPATYGHINDLFGKNFQLNFGDSEQTIRLFINKISPKEKYAQGLPQEKPWSILHKFTTQCAKIKSIHQQKKLTDSASELNELEKQIIPNVNQWIENNLSGTLEIASYYDMCGNCQATFKYDFEARKHVARTIFITFVNTIQDKDNEALIWCLKGWAYDPPKSGLILSMPKINLIVSSLEKYGD